MIAKIFVFVLVLQIVIAALLETALTRQNEYKLQLSWRLCIIVLLKLAQINNSGTMFKCYVEILYA